MTKKYTIYFGGYTEPYYLREPKEVKGLLEDYNKDPDKLTDDLQDLNDQLDQLTKERDEAKDKHKKQLKVNGELMKFLKDELGFANMDEAHHLLKGKKVKEVLIELEKERKDARDAEKITQKTADKLQADLNKFVALMTKWGVNDLIELNLLLDGWSRFPILNQSVNQLLNKESVADLKELDDKIKEIKQNLQTTATERDEARKKRDQYKADRDKLRKKVNTIKPSWDFIVDKINKCKTVIIGDLQKKKIRHHMGQIAGEFAWTVPNVNEESGEE